MATLYSNLYGTTSKQVTSSGAITTSTERIYYGPSIHQQGGLCVRTATFTGTIANGDVLKIAGNFVQGERLKTFDCSMSADPDAATATPNLGFTSDIDAILAATALFQAGADVNIETSGQAVATFTCTKGDELLFTMTTGAHANTATYTFVIVTAV